MDHGDDSSFLHMTGLSQAAFNMLLSVIFCQHIQYIAGKRDGNDNFRTDVVGFNQIATVFDLEYERVVKLEGYDRISQYYYCPGDYNSDEDVSDREYLFDEDKLE